MQNLGQRVARDVVGVDDLHKLVALLQLLVEPVAQGDVRVGVAERLDGEVGGKRGS